MMPSWRREPTRRTLRRGCLSVLAVALLCAVAPAYVHAQNTYQTINVQGDGTTQDTDCTVTTTFTSAQTVGMLEEPVSCTGTKEDKIKWTFGGTEGTNETNLLVTYLTTGYSADTLITGQATGNDVNFKSHNEDGTFRIKLVEANPSTGAVISVLDTKSVAVTSGTWNYITDLSDLTGTVSSGNALGFQLTFQADVANTAIELKFGKYTDTLRRMRFSVDEVDLSLPRAALTGTLADDAAEFDITVGGETLIITLTNDTWVATVGDNNSITTALIAGLDSAQAEDKGWDAVVKANMDYNDVTRTSDTVVTITLGAEATFDITAAETITATLPASALVTSTSAVVATPTFQITTSGAAVAALTGTLADGATNHEIWVGGQTLVITLTSDHWDDTVGGDNAITTALIAGIDSDGAEALGWDATVKNNLVAFDVTRTSDTVVTIALQKEYGYTITATETITATVPASALKYSGALVATPTFDITQAVSRTFQTWNVQADGTTQDTDCLVTTTFTSAQTVGMLEEPVSCTGTKEDKIKWTFGATEGTNETTVATTYFDNSGYAIATKVTGQASGNDVNFKSHNEDGTFRIKLVEANPSTGAVISVLDTKSVAVTSGTWNYITDLSELTGLVGIGNTFGFQLTFQADNANGTDIETKFGKYADSTRRYLWHVYEEPDLTLLTAVELIAFSGIAYDLAVLLEWQTGYEIDNLGFNLYREIDGERLQLTPSLVAGSGLLAQRGMAVTSVQAYAWWDHQATVATPNLLYWLEDIDFDGTSTWHGPMTPVAGGHLIGVGPPAPGEGVAGENSRSLSRLADVQGARRRTFFTDDQSPSVTRSVATTEAETALETQWAVAQQSTVKIGVRRTGWVRVTQAELVAAGLDATVDPRRLQLFADGVEQAVTVTGEADGQFDPTDAIGFYGRGVDTTYTDIRVYWVVTGGQPGLRILAATPAPTATAASAPRARANGSAGGRRGVRRQRPAPSTTPTATAAPTPPPAPSTAPTAPLASPPPPTAPPAPSTTPTATAAPTPPPAIAPTTPPAPSTAPTVPLASPPPPTAPPAPSTTQTPAVPAAVAPNVTTDAPPNTRPKRRRAARPTKTKRSAPAGVAPAAIPGVAPVPPTWPDAPAPTDTPDASGATGSTVPPLHRGDADRSDEEIRRETQITGEFEIELGLARAAGVSTTEINEAIDAFDPASDPDASEQVVERLRNATLLALERAVAAATAPTPPKTGKARPKKEKR